MKFFLRGIHMNQSKHLDEYKPDAVFYNSAEGARNATPEFMAKAREAVLRIHAKRAYQAQLRERKAFHAAVLNRMEADSHFADLVRVEARRRIALWRKSKTCSELYPETWETIIELDTVADMRKAVLEDPDWSDALQQNSAISGLYIHQLMDSE